MYQFARGGAVYPDELHVIGYTNAQTLQQLAPHELLRRVRKEASIQKTTCLRELRLILLLHSHERAKRMLNRIDR